MITLTEKQLEDLLYRVARSVGNPVLNPREISRILAEVRLPADQAALPGLYP